jgi:hypothetical protein
MPVTIRKRGDKFRIVEQQTGNIAKNKGGTAIDGGGHGSKAQAVKQVGAVNTPKSKRRGK